MQTPRRIAIVALWSLAAVGTIGGLLWGATAAGAIQPLAVISGSMEPEIMTGDLLIATRTPVAELEVGDVVSLPSEFTSNLVTHRIVTIRAVGDGAVVTMKGDANEAVDALDYRVTGDVWRPAMQVPGAGAVVARATLPVAAALMLVGVVAFLWLTRPITAPERRVTRARRSGAPHPEAAR